MFIKNPEIRESQMNIVCRTVMVQSFRSEEAYPIDTAKEKGTVRIFIARTGIELVGNQIIGYFIMGKTPTFRIEREDTVIRTHP